MDSPHIMPSYILDIADIPVHKIFSSAIPKYRCILYYRVNCFRFEPFPDLFTHACQIWSRSDGCVRKKRGQTDRHTHKGTQQLYIILDAGAKRSIADMHLQMEEYCFMMEKRTRYLPDIHHNKANELAM